jgi:hypothetical protein
LILPIFLIFSLTALGMGKTRKQQQRGGGLSVITSQIESIQHKQNELSTSVGNVDERALAEALEEALRTRGKSKQIEADIRFYTESFLKDEKTIKDLFERQESVPSEYIGLITVLGNYSKMRNDMDTLIKSIYRYINLRLGYPLGSGEEPDYSSPAPRLNRRYEEGNNTASVGLPALVGQAGNATGGSANSKSRIPELVKKVASDNNLPENVQAPDSSFFGFTRSRTRRRSLRKKY